MVMRSTISLLAVLVTVWAQDSASPTPTVPPAASGAVTSGGSIASDLPQQPLTTISGFSVPALSELTSGAPEGPTVPLDTTYTQGTQPTAVSGAPALPNPTLTIANYPALDRVPPTDSPQVQQWLSQIDFSRVPTYGQTNGVCSDYPGAITDGRCWWTCGGCTRSTDITVCPDALDWGLSFDDGPSPYTPLLLDYLNQNNLKSTFFVVGSRVLSRPEMLQSEYVSGHQISIHTWSHSYLTNLTNEQIVAELGWTRQVIKDVIGVSPNTFRPPYGDIDDRVRAIAAQMGMTPIIWSAIEANGTSINFDTTDWNIPGGQATGETALSKFEQIVNEYVPRLDTGFIVLAHDIYQQTVDLAVGYVLPKYLAENRFKMKSIIDCLGRPLSEAYVETSSNTTATFVTSAASTYFQPNVGSQGGAAVTPTSGGGGSSAASGSGGSGSVRPSGSASGAASQPTGAASKRMDGMSIFALGPIVAALCVVGTGMALVA